LRPELLQRLKSGQKFLSVSKCTDPKINADGSVEIYVGPAMAAGGEKNWIKTVPGKGWFPIFRFYGPLEPLHEDLGAQRHRRSPASRRDKARRTGEGRWAQTRSTEGYAL
jgi:Protein of unknown function (DUF1214)